ncbi:MAG: DUF1223 domain-containing protein [Candidatus Omnitrophica bacterium CG11_big_fil_rev_8_21_14_0_20_45_26]|uniref:DUF1223 domain-containing protein n=1 Tax=Candidatus Abzuiibacterium crystallinum TaxID=1974748 RepID=A0A2H0LQE7_9BACT|nr:MAG: DUF1223 domain-containing protein [Candidatus Omnitrophica bacterium CG11_big_fil_rev_8_21_14_0_20_45_26]PIW64001.1 MAG: DUF1223 domain-containing protein [Candidatus Omnitrophica bacterium CG12_big_fil_rev_8_21_14_0_65_45_16]
MTHASRSVWPAVFCLLIFGPVNFLHAQETITFQSTPAQTVLLELYTSEGCSSCPPADQKLSAYQADKELWIKYIPIGFHVTYWDELGWVDRWARPEFTQRQSAYVRAWRSRTLATPTFVFNGRDWRNWFAESRELSLDERAGLLKASVSDLKEVKVTFDPLGKPEAGWEAHLSLLAFGVTSQVQAGENRGKQLKHDFVAVHLQDHPLENKGRGLEASFEIHPEDAGEAERLGLAVWVTKKDGMIPQQAAGGYLT